MHLEHTALIVHDYDEAIRFFVDALGFELIEDSPSATDDGRPKRWVVVRPPGAATGLLLAKRTATDSSPLSATNTPAASDSFYASTTSTLLACACSTTASSW